MAAPAFYYEFEALRGRQAAREYYVAMAPLKLLPKLFLLDDEELKPEFRAQRKLNRARVPEITQYITEHPREYVFSSLTLSIDGRPEFVPSNNTKAAAGNAGLLRIPMDARLVVNDGQHRRAAIEEALKVRPELANETISIVFFVDAGLRRSQQMFADLNRHAIRPTRSLGILYDHRDPLSQLACRLASDVPPFRDLTETDKSTISNRSRKLFTLSSIYFSTRQLLRKTAGSPVSEDESAFALEFWREVAKHMRDWQNASRGTVSSAELRRDFIHAHGVALQAIALAGSDLVEAHPRDWKPKLTGLRRVDWSRNNTSTWEGRATIGGRVSKATNNVLLTANVVKAHLGLPLRDGERAVENIHTKGRVVATATTSIPDNEPRPTHA
jgi:DNA sulfur modification protein DndB